MPSEPDLLNDALGQIGATAITAIDDGSTNANHCLVFYPPLRDGMLRSHHWNFALKWVQLAQDVTPPIAQFAYAYTLPSDCLKVVNYGGSLPVPPSVPLAYTNATSPYEAYYKIEGRKLVSNDGTVYIQYIRQVTNPDEWDAIFYQLVSVWLASKLATAIHHDYKMSMALMSYATNTLLPLATAVDGQEGSQEPFIVNDLLWGRSRV